ncbi:MAG TPA: amidohydrolase family protein [Galbitalea sp.]|jgi:imidazolonepropionase-like amidohydrolase
MTDTTQQEPFAITNVRVFDGAGLSEPRMVVVADGLISSELSSGNVIDGAGGTLLPGFIDAHVHLDSPDNLTAFATWGVTTGLDMGTNPRSLVDSMRNVAGLTDIRSALSPASGPGGLQTTMNTFAPSTVLFGPDDAEAFIADRVAEGCDFVKIIIEDPADKGDAALGADTIAAIVTAAHAAGFLTIAHASSDAAVQLGIDAGVDFLTHVPLRSPVTAGQIATMVDKGIAIIPTLSMMEGIGAKFGMPTGGPGPGIHVAQASVRAMREAGVPILAGTDANNAPFVPFSPKLGESLHGELELLVGAGLTPAEALRSATELVADSFALHDRGRIAAGLRADLILVDGDPTSDISATRAIRGVWITGNRVR